jgi:hypothetical protein
MLVYERIRLWLAFSLWPLPVYRRVRHRFPLNRGMDGPWSQYGRFREEKSVAPRMILVRNYCEICLPCEMDLLLCL